jgi:hypothetical protein
LQLFARKNTGQLHRFACQHYCLERVIRPEDAKPLEAISRTPPYFDIIRNSRSIII